MNKRLLVLVLLFCMLMPVQVYAASESNDDDSIGVVALLAAGPAFYWSMRRKYAAADVRAKYELDTECRLSNMKMQDSFSESVKRSRNSTIDNYVASTQKDASLRSLAGVRALFK